MATTKQKAAAKKNIAKARTTSSRPSMKKRTGALSTAEKNDLKESQFAFPEQRKEPLVDAKHVRNAIARFDQVEGVSDADRDKAWRRIRSAARKFDVEIKERGWRQLFEGGKAKKKS